MARSRATTPASSELKNISYEIFIGLLSIMSIVNIVLGVFIKDPGLQQILGVMNGLFSLIFLIDFTYRICTAPSAARYFFRGFGWADLLASLPFAELKILRLFRVLRVYRLMRDLGPRTIVRRVIHDRANSALMTLLLMGVIVMQYGSLFILHVEEHAPGANITSASDALWYTIVTISTVGYGDQYPVTSAGRMIGSVIIIVGVGIFGTFTGYLANLFLAPRKAEEQTDAASADAVPTDAGTDAPAPSSAPAPAPAPAPAKLITVDGSAEGIAKAASRGVAAGGVSGAVSAGAKAGSPGAKVGSPAASGAAGSGTGASGAKGDEPLADASGTLDTALLQQLLGESEDRIVEIRRLLAGVG